MCSDRRCSWKELWSFSDFSTITQWKIFNFHPSKRLLNWWLQQKRVITFILNPCFMSLPFSSTRVRSSDGRKKSLNGQRFAIFFCCIKIIIFRRWDFLARYDASLIYWSSFDYVNSLAVQLACEGKRFRAFRFSIYCWINRKYQRNALLVPGDSLQQQRNNNVSYAPWHHKICP